MFLLRNLNKLKQLQLLFRQQLLHKAILKLLQLLFRQRKPNQKLIIKILEKSIMNIMACGNDTHSQMTVKHVVKSHLHN